jgi:septal ring factor EnvC (AmiA/AmiB activator)
MGVDWKTELSRLTKLEATIQEHTKRIRASKDRAAKQDSRLDELESRITDIEYEILSLRQYAAEARLDHLMDWGQRILYTYLNSAQGQPQQTLAWQCIMSLREQTAKYKQIVRGSETPESDVDQWISICQTFCAQKGYELILA